MSGALSLQVSVLDYQKSIGTKFNIDDIAIFLETEGLLEKMYSMVAMGSPQEEIAETFKLDTESIEYILKRTPDAQKKYLMARSVALGDKSLEALNDFSEKKGLEVKQSAAAVHHRKMSELALKSVGSITSSSGSGIVVNNQIIVNNETPDAPKEIRDLIDA